MLPDDEHTLNVHEIYRTIQGETTRAGLPCVIVRLSGCDLRCAWCDTQYAAGDTPGTIMTITEIGETAAELGPHLVCLTGGEPMLQQNAPRLAAYFCAAGYTTLVETNGVHDIAPLKEPIVRIVDVKCPSSGMSRHTNWYNLQHLRPTDEVKFVIAVREDYEYAREIVEKHRIDERCQILLSPVLDQLEPAHLAEWMLWDDLRARLQLQLHKYIWPAGEPGSVGRRT